MPPTVYVPARSPAGMVPLPPSGLGGQVGRAELMAPFDIATILMVVAAIDSRSEGAHALPPAGLGCDFSGV